MGVLYREGEAVSVTGAKLFTAAYLPDAGPPTAILVFHHGLAEHIGRYKSMATTLADRGIAVYLHDAFGHGRSEGDRAYIPSMGPMVADFVARRETAESEMIAAHPESTIPTFIGGHSMGGMVAVLAAEAHQERLSGLLSLSPLLGVAPTLGNRIQIGFGRVAVHIAPRLKVPAVDPKGLNRDPRLVQEYIDDPLNTTGPLELKTLVSVLQGAREASLGAPTVTVPLYLHHGLHDAITYEPATREFYKAATGCKDKTFVPIEEGCHEILLGPEKDVAIAAIGDWILDHAGPAAAKL